MGMVTFTVHEKLIRYPYNPYAMDSPDPSLKYALLFMPDITGFTHFIGDRDFQHGQHIIAELLEVLMEANQLELEVGEVEGDAIFFYRLGEKPKLTDLITQAESMYIAFHNHLKKYGVSRLCNCPTCQSASRLTLKFVAHYGSVSFHNVKSFEKLFGTDVILVHRLLKNTIPDREYLLVTESLLMDHMLPPEEDELNWKSGSNEYDLGDVKYAYTSIGAWYDKVPEPEIPEVKMYRTKNPLVHSIEIMAPLEMLYESLIDLSQRKKYVAGMKGLEIENPEVNRLNRICTTFKCSMEHEKCSFETSGVELGDNRISFSETFKEFPMTFEYVLERLNGKTLVSIIVHPMFTFPMNVLYHVVMKRKLISETNQTLRQLKTYGEEKAVQNSMAAL